MQIFVTKRANMAIKSSENDNNCIIVGDPCLGHCPMGLDLRWIEKIAGGKGETEDQAL